MNLNINFTDEEINWLKAYAETCSMSINDAIKQLVFDRIEDEYDLACAEIAYKKHMENDEKTYSFSEALEELKLN